MAISKTSCAALVISIVALVFAVWPLAFPAKGESITPYVTFNAHTRELSLEERVMELQCWMVNFHQEDKYRWNPNNPQKHKSQMECSPINPYLKGEVRD